MIPRQKLARLASMHHAELAWRLRAAARNAVGRAQTSIASPRWNRRDLSRVLAHTPELADVRRALDGGRWPDAHAALLRFVVDSPQRFVVAPSCRKQLVSRVVHEFPSSAHDAVERADRVVAGEYQLLGHQGLRFRSSSGLLDWHVDPVLGRRAPVSFWKTVPFLDSACGDHKVIWELNRHQHWLTLGRAFWLTGDPRYRVRMIDELASWLSANPPLMGINWASMLELGLRSLSWVWAINVFAIPQAPDEPPWSIDLLLALDRQLAHVERNLSHYFSPNTHLLGEALALYVTARALPIFVDSTRREAIGRHILREEMGRQIASDGGHCERSAHYHRYTLDFYLLALAVARITHDAAAAVHFESAVARLASAARLLANDRGRLPHVGDEDGGDTLPVAGRAPDDVASSLAAAAILVGRPELCVAEPPEDTYWLLAHPRFTRVLERATRRATPPVSRPSAALAETGYYVSRSACGDHLVLDAGPHGYQNGGHAHADALSVTFTLGHLPFLIDPGTGSYTADRELRDRFRSTALHNTLSLDGRSQSTPSGPFHWSRSANATIVHARTGADFDYFVASHDGYRPSEHRRHVLCRHGDLLIVADLLAGEGHHQADVHWHIDPRWRVDQLNGHARFVSEGSAVSFFAPCGQMALFAGDAETGLGWYSPIYGRVEPALTLRLRLAGPLPLWVVSVFGLDPANEIHAVDITTESVGSAIARGIGLLIARADVSERVFMSGKDVSCDRVVTRRRCSTSG